MHSEKKGLHVIVGLGATGLSCANYLMKQGVQIAIADSRANPPNLSEFKEKHPEIPLYLGDQRDSILQQAATIVMSPGVSVQDPVIQQQIQRGIPVIGDIEIFAQDANAPIIGITGTNAKSTVTTLVGKMAESAGLKVQVGGNLGIPALDLLTTPRPELFVLELSSFQLETTYSLNSEVATVLNITPDHMDRYQNLQEYIAAKKRIYTDCEVAVCNRDDVLTDCGELYHSRKIFFTLQQPKTNEFGLLKKNGENYLAFEDNALMPVRELPILGRHYQANALAALAIGYGYGLAFEPMLQTLSSFKGLAHRCQLVRELLGVYWYNDSKGTNVGATLAAIEGLGSELQGKIVLIAGGLGKNADFTSLLPAIEKYVKTAILIGEAAQELSDLIGNRIAVERASSMQEAVTQAKQIASTGDSVLLSPACASFDMFKNFEHRGEVFTALVQGLQA